MVAALRKLGGDYILDTNFGADMTIMEEASELLERVINSDAVLPQFTSCCPAWVKFAETFYPEFCQTCLQLRVQLLCKRLRKKHTLLKKWALMLNKSLLLQ